MFEKKVKKNYRNRHNRIKEIEKLYHIESLDLDNSFGSKPYTNLKLFDTLLYIKHIK